MAQARFTDQTKEAILKALRLGHFAKVAARLAGIHPSTFFYWMELGEKQKDDPDSEYAKFAMDVERARAQAEHRAIREIRKAGKEDWKAYAWWAERAHPDRWARKDWRQGANEPGDDDYTVDLSPPEEKAPPSEDGPGPDDECQPGP